MTDTKKIIRAMVLTRLSFLKGINKAKKKIAKSLVLIYTIIWTSIIIFSITEYEGTSHSSINFYHFTQFIVFAIIIMEVCLRCYFLGDNLKTRFLSLFRLMHIVLIISSLSLLENFWLIYNHNLPLWFTNMASLKIFRLIRVFPFLTLVPGMRILCKVIEKEQSPLRTIFVLVLVFIMISAIVIYHLETSQRAIDIAKGKANLKIHNFLDAIYFSTIAITTIGFGDITPITEPGKVFMIFISLSGVVVVALPTAVISGGFISHIAIIRKEAALRDETQIFRMKK